MQALQVRIIDSVLMMIVIILVVLGFVMVMSASNKLAQIRFEYPWHYTIQHGLHLLLAGCAFMVVQNIAMSFWRKISFPAFIFAVCIAIWFLFFNSASPVEKMPNAMSRHDFFSHPTEWWKLVIPLGLSACIVALNRNEKNSFMFLLLPVVIGMLPVALLVLEMEFYTASVLACCVVMMLLISGFRFFHVTFIAVTIFAIASVISAFYLEFETIARMQPLFALANGGLWGQGFGESIYKIAYLPEPHRSLLFAVLCEELGIVIGMVVVGLFGFLALIGLQIGRLCDAQNLGFAALLALSSTVLLFIQAIMNIGMNVGFLATATQVLPFVGFGFDSLVVNAILLGFIFRALGEYKKKLGIGND